MFYFIQTVTLKDKNSINITKSIKNYKLKKDKIVEKTSLIKISIINKFLRRKIFITY